MNRIVDGSSRCLQGLQRGWSREPRETGSGRQKVSASCLGALFQIGCCQVIPWHHLSIMFWDCFLEYALRYDADTAVRHCWNNCICSTIVILSILHNIKIVASTGSQPVINKTVFLCVCGPHLSVLHVSS